MDRCRHSPPDAQSLRFDRNTVLCSHPPVCVLFQRDTVNHQAFEGIDTFSVRVDNI